MHTLTRPYAEMVSNRVGEVESLLSGIRSGPPPRTRISRQTVQMKKVLSAFDGSDHGDWQHRDKFFTLESCSLLGQYFEMWKPSPDHQDVTLERAYFHLVRRDRKQILCIHAEPLTAGGAGDAGATSYKKGVHLHLKAAEQPLPKCHFPLVVDDTDSPNDRVYKSIECFSKTMQNAITAVRLEVLPLYHL